MSELKESFVRMIREHEKLIYKVCYCYATVSADREDLYQEIVLQCWKAYSGFKGQSKAGTWLYRVALNTAISGKRKETRRVQLQDLEAPLLDKLPENTLDPEQEQMQQLYRMIAALPVLDRALVVLYFEDRPHAEIAEIMGISAGNVATRLGRIRSKLRQQTSSQINN